MAQPSRDWAQRLPEHTPMRESRTQRLLFVAYLGSCMYVGGTLPCARFYYEGEEGFFGNLFLRTSYQYLYAYLAVALH